MGKFSLSTQIRLFFSMILQSNIQYFVLFQTGNDHFIYSLNFTTMLGTIPSKIIPKITKNLEHNLKEAFTLTYM